MEGVGITRVLGRTLVAFSVVFFAATPAQADDGADGNAALNKARAAWDRGALKEAESAYRDAIEKGGLEPSEVLEGYVHLGVIRSSLGKKDQAVAAFRAAAVLDDSFVVPPEAGRRGAALAARAKKDTAKFGSLIVTIEAPKETPSEKTFRIVAHIDALHVPIVDKIALVAREGVTSKTTTMVAKAGESVTFDVPAEFVTPYGNILARVDALDRHANRLASAEARVRMTNNNRPLEGPLAKPVPVPATPASKPSLVVVKPASTPRDSAQEKGGTFWSSPWPYVIGGVVLAGAGAAVFVATRPSDDVTIGQVGVRTR